MRTSHSQYLTLVEFMEENGDLSKPGGGPRGRHYVQEKWKELTNLLNSDGSGDPKTEDKWRKTWSDFKNNVKKKQAKISRHASGTGGGPALQLLLTDVEDRVLKIIGLRAAIGMPVGEAGFPEGQTSIPTAQAREYSVGSPLSPVHHHDQPSTSDQWEDQAALVWPSPPPPPLIAEGHWQPAPKRKKNDDVASLFVSCDEKAREYARERDRANERLETERLRLREEELRLRELDLRERLRQRDLELQLQTQWLEFMKECLNVVKKYFDRE